MSGYTREKSFIHASIAVDYSLGYFSASTMNERTQETSLFLAPTAISAFTTVPPARDMN